MFMLALPAGSRRFWITVLSFAILNASAWVAYDRYHESRQRGALRIEAFQPGDGAVAGARPTLRWQFNDDVVPTSVYGKDPGVVTPPVSGTWAWEDPRTLTFTPNADFPRATRVTFTLADQFIRGSNGATLAKPYSTSIQSTPLAVTAVRQAANQAMDRFVVELTFNDRVAPGDVLSHLTATTADGHAVHCELYGQAADKTVRIITDSIPQVPNGPREKDSTPLNIRLSPGLAGLSGPLGLAAPYATSINLTRQLAAVELTAESPARERPYLILRFNNHIDTSVLKEIASVEPAVPFTIEQYGDGARLVGDFQPATRYAVTLAAAPRGADPTQYPAAGRLSAYVPDRQSGVWFDNDEGYLSSDGNRTLMAHSINIKSLRVSVTRVYDNNLVAWRTAGRYDWSNTSRFATTVATQTIALPSELNKQHDLRLTLNDLLPANARRDGVYRIALASADAHSDTAYNGRFDADYDPYDGDSAVVTLSDIGLTAKETHGGVTVWATSLRSASPLSDVRVRVYSSKSQLLGEAITDATGVASIADVHPAKGESVVVVLADRVPPQTPDTTQPTADATTMPAVPESSDLTWLDVRNTAWDLGDSDTGGQKYLRQGYEAFVYTDRGVYRPGETVHLKAIVRGADLAAPGAAFPVRWQIRRPDQHDWKSVTVMLDADGSATLDLPLAADLPTGPWTACIGQPGTTGSTAANSADGTLFGSAVFQVEEFIPSRMKVSLTFKGTPGDDADDKPPSRSNIAAGPLGAAVQGDYLIGRPAAGLGVELSTRLDPISFSPQGWDVWSFGDTARVYSDSGKSGESATPARKSAAPQTTAATLDANGHYDWSIDVADALGFKGDAAPNPADNKYTGPWRLTAASGVHETGGRTVTATGRIDVDLLPYYLAARLADGSTARPGQPCNVQIKLVRPDGARASDAAVIEAKLLRQDWNTTLVYRDGRYQYNSNRVLEPVHTETLKLDSDADAWSPAIPSSGSYIAAFRDTKTGAFTSIEFYATDGSPWDDNVSRDNPEHLDVRILDAGVDPTTQPDAPKPAVASKPAAPFRVGQTANVLIASPFAGRLLLTVETDQVVQTRVIDMTSSHVVVPISVTQDCWPNAYVTATVVRGVDPDAKWQTHRAFGVTRLRVDPADRTLKVSLTGPAEIRPLQSLDIGIAVRDSQGNPAANAAVTVAAVDEGICQLTAFATPNPVSFFARDRALSVRSSDLFGLLMPEVPRPQGASSTGGDGSAPSTRHITPVVARRVTPVALAWATVHTDADGTARASFPIPEFQGRLRVMAIAFDKTSSGSADKPVTVRSPVSSQSSWPRFAAPGDQFTVPIVLFNNTPTAGDATVSVENLPDAATPANLVSFGPDHKQQLVLSPLSLPAGGQRQVNIQASIGQAVGVAKLHLHVVMNGEGSDENLELPVRPAAPLTQFGGVAAASTTQPAAIPAPVAMMSGTDTLAIRISPRPALNLPQALDYLDRYPYGCVEQTTSAAMPLLSLNDIGAQIDPARFDPAMVKVKIDSAVMQLISMQTADGGLAMWPGGQNAWPWGSIYAAHFLVQARLSGYDVPDDFYNHLLTYVRHQLDDESDEPGHLEQRAYAGFVLSLAGKPDRAMLDRLTELSTAKDPLNVDGDAPRAMRSNARLMLACAWLLAGRHDLADGLLPDALPIPRSTRQTSGNIGSGIRDRAMLIYTLATVRPADPRLPDLIQKLADSGLHHEWYSTQDTAFSILAIGQYLHQAGKTVPYATAQLFSGDQLLAEAQGGNPIAWNRPAIAPAVNSPTTQPGASVYTVKIFGPADSSAYVTWMQSGIPLAPPPDAQHGITITRRYLTRDGQNVHDNTVESGDLIRVELTIEAPADQSNIVIEDMLPAGLEAENSALKTSVAKRGSEDDAAGDEGEVLGKDQVPAISPNRVDIRDDRVVIMFDMHAHTQRYEYYARAVTPGVYAMPPVRAEAMYDIAQNGLSGAGGKFTVLSPSPNIATIRDQ